MISRVGMKMALVFVVLKFCSGNTVDAIVKNISGLDKIDVTGFTGGIVNGDRNYLRCQHDLSWQV